VSAQAPQLEFNEAEHAYYVGGERLLNVTQVLAELGMVDTRFFTEEARLRGQAVHLACQYDDEGVLNEDDLDPVLAPYLEAWRRFVADYEFEAELIEKRLWSAAYRYAGTVDRVGKARIANNGADKRRVAIDLKTGAALPAYPLQLAGYVNLLDEPTSYLRLKVELKPTGKYKVWEYPITTYARDLNVFLSGVGVLQWKKENKLWAPQ